MINKLILGTVQLGLTYGINNKIGQLTKSECYEILFLAKSSGIEFLDSAEAYGAAHEIIGNFHLDNPKAKFKILTKFPHHVSGEKLSDKLDYYISNLNVPYLEAIMFHSYESYISNKNHLGEVSTYKQQGLINNLGVSIYTNSQFEEVIEDPNIDLIQIPYNLLDNTSQRGNLIRKAKAQNKEIHVRSVFLQGLFFMDRNEKNKILSKLLPEIKLIDNLCRQFDVEVGPLALQYALKNPDIDHVLIGVDSALQLKWNLEAINKEIPHGIFEAIDQLIVSDNQLLNPSLWHQI